MCQNVGEIDRAWGGKVVQSLKIAGVYVVNNQILILAICLALLVAGMLIIAINVDYQPASFQGRRNKKWRIVLGVSLVAMAIAIFATIMSMDLPVVNVRQSAPPLGALLLLYCLRALTNSPFSDIINALKVPVTKSNGGTMFRFLRQRFGKDRTDPEQDRLDQFVKLFGFNPHEFYLYQQNRRELLYRLMLVAKMLALRGTELAASPNNTVLHGHYKVWHENWTEQLEVLGHFHPALRDRIAECHWSQNLSQRLESLLNGEVLPEEILLFPDELRAQIVNYHQVEIIPA